MNRIDYSIKGAWRYKFEKINKGRIELQVYVRQDQRCWGYGKTILLEKQDSSRIARSILIPMSRIAKRKEYPKNWLK